MIFLLVNFFNNKVVLRQNFKNVRCNNNVDFQVTGQERMKTSSSVRIEFCGVSREIKLAHFLDHVQSMSAKKDLFVHGKCLSNCRMKIYSDGDNIKKNRKIKTN